MQTSITEYKRQKREYKVLKIPQKALTLQSKKMQKCKNLVTQNIQKIQHTMRRPNLRIIGIEECEDNMCFYIYLQFYQKYFPCKSSILSENIYNTTFNRLRNILCLQFYLYKVANFNVFFYIFLEFNQRYFPCTSSVLSENVFNSSFNQLRNVFMASILSV